MPRRLRPRGTKHYDKPPMEHTALMQRLEHRGLVITDPDRTIRYLRHIGYYRLSPYTIPFLQNREDHLFKTGTSFDDVLDLYIFDRALRLLVLDALERVEIAVRSALVDHMSTKYRDAHWYTDASHFRDDAQHSTFLRMITKLGDDRLRGRPDEGEDVIIHRSALEHYLITYGSPELPPSWVMSEIITIGQLYSIYKNLSRRADRNAVAHSVGIESAVLESWLTTYVRVRNICAHHGRLWNVGIGVYPAIPRSSKISWFEGDFALPEQSRKRLYPVLVSLQTILNVISPRSSWSKRLFDLLLDRPAMNLIGMGVPESWHQDPFWSRRIGP